MSTLDEQKDLVRQAMSIIGSAKTERKLEALAKNRAKFTGHTEETKAKLREGQALRRERERLEREAQGITTEAKQARPVGRPRKETVPTLDTENTPKRGRGRPRKSDGAQIPLPNADVAQTGE